MGIRFHSALRVGVYSFITHFLLGYGGWLVGIGGDGALDTKYFFMLTASCYLRGCVRSWVDLGGRVLAVFG